MQVLCNVLQLKVFAGRWIACCKRVEEVNIDRNLIGDAGANELLMALQQRKEGGHPAIKLAVTNKVHSELFEALLALTASKTKKGKKKKKKGKKVQSLCSITSSILNCFLLQKK